MLLHTIPSPCSKVPGFQSQPPCEHEQMVGRRIGGSSNFGGGGSPSSSSHASFLRSPFYLLRSRVASALVMRGLDITRG